jgi:hypothetical protein
MTYNQPLNDSASTILLHVSAVLLCVSERLPAGSLTMTEYVEANKQVSLRKKCLVRAEYLSDTLANISLG